MNDATALLTGEATNRYQRRTTTEINVYANHSPPGAQTIDSRQTMKRRAALQENENHRDKSNDCINIPKTCNQEKARPSQARQRVEQSTLNPDQSDESATRTW